MHRLILKKRRSNRASGATSRGVASFPSGLKLLYQGEDCVVDIVFVHGLTGDRERTWRHEEEQLPWPQTLLPQKIPNCRVLTFGYDAYVTDLKGLDRMVSTSTVLDHGSSLVLNLANLRAEDGTSGRPLIFVTHSLGGIVCKDGLCYAAKMEGEPRLQTLFSSTCGVLFMGTPHQGSSLAPWAQGIAGTLGFVKQTDKRLLKVLRTDSELLSRVNEAFLTLVENRKAPGSPLSPIRISCFFEELPLPVVGLIVPRASAVLPGHIIIGIHGNHRDMARFRQSDDRGFLSVVGELSECIRSVTLQRCPVEVPVLTPSPALRAESQPSLTPFIVPFSRNDSFVGRSEIIQRLKTVLHHQPDSSNKYQSHHRAALYGLGGIGKTQIAIEYAWQLHQEAPDVFIFWIRASTADRFVQSYTQIARQFQIPGFDDPAEGKLELVKDWLVSCPSRWLLVIDNADDSSVLFGDGKPPSAADFLRPESQPASATGSTAPARASPLCQYIPESPNGAVLLTSRNKQVASKFLRGRSKGLVSVPGFSDEDGTQFIQDMIGDQEDREAVLALVTKLERLPLALSQAAAYTQTRCITISKYLDLLRESLVELFEQPFEDHGRDDADIPNAVAATWALSFNQIQAQNPLAGTLISVMSCLDRENIPRDFLYTCLENSASDGAPKPSNVQIEDALGLLKAYSLTTESFGGKLLTIHRLVHVVARSWLQRKGEHVSVGELVLVSIWKSFSSPFDNWCFAFFHFMIELIRTIAYTGSPLTCKDFRVLAQVNVSRVLTRLWLDAHEGERGVLKDALKLFQRSVNNLDALVEGAIGFRFAESLLALLNHEISWEEADELFSGLETEATAKHGADNMYVRWAQWGRGLVQIRCPSICKIRAIAAKENLEKVTSIKELLGAVAGVSGEDSAAGSPEVDEAAARNAAYVKTMIEHLSRAEADLASKLEEADHLHEEARVQLDAFNELMAMCRDLKEKFEAKPLEERLATFGAATWNEYFAGKAAEKRLERGGNLRGKAAD